MIGNNRTFAKLRPSRGVNVALVLAAVGAVLGGIGFWYLAICARVVGPDDFLVLTRKYGSAKPAGQILAQGGERGVMEVTLGTGRHFINPIFFQVKRTRATKIGTTQIGIVTSKAGPTPKSGTWLAERGERGVWREVLGPGVYKLNPVAYTIDIVGMTGIAPGYVGVLINNLTSAVEARTLPPGLHKINTKLYKVVPVDVGVKHLGYSRKGRVAITEAMLLQDEESAEVLKSNKAQGGAIEFPSRDGFNVGLDSSIVYEVEPKHGVSLLSKFGNTGELTKRIIEPALRSVTRNVGSSITAKEIIQGETRISFQESFTKNFLEELKSQPVRAIDALPRALYVPLKIQLPIMKATLKLETTKTNKEVEKTAELQDQQERAKKEVDFEIQSVKSETDYEVSNINSLILKELAAYRATIATDVAKLDLKGAKIDADTRLIQATGEAEVVEYRGDRKAQLITLRAAALGGRENLVLLNFVNSLPARIPFRVLHAGEGTLWTDLKGLDAKDGALLDKARGKRSR